MLIERVLTLLRERADCAPPTPSEAPVDAGVRVAQVAVALNITPQQAVAALHLLVRKNDARRLGRKPYRYVVAPPVVETPPLPPLPVLPGWTPPRVIAPMLACPVPGRRGVA